jgi:hypothetical protein
MWLVKSKSDKEPELWSTVGAYDNKTGAIIHASRLLDESLMIIVTDPYDNIIWGLNEMSVIEKAEVENVLSFRK